MDSSDIKSSDKKSSLVSSEAYYRGFSDGVLRVREIPKPTFNFIKSEIN